MQNIDSHTWIISLSLMSLSLMFYTSGIDVDRVREATVMDLIILRNYEKRVESHEACKVDEGLRKEFMDTWGNILGVINAKNLLKQLEKDWKYTLDLANSNENKITPLVVALHTKMVAYHQGWNFILCMMFHSLEPEPFRPKNCRNVAAYLLVFSYIGTEELVAKFLSVFEFFLSSDYVHSIEKFLFYVSLIPQDYEDDLEFRPGLPSSQQENPFRELIKFAQFCNYMRHIDEVRPDHMKLIDKVTMPMKLGYLGKDVAIKKSLPFEWQTGYLKIMWSQAETINRRIVRHMLESSEANDINIMVHVVLVITILKIEFIGLHRRDFMELYEHAEWNMPDFEFLRVEEDLFVHNLNLTDYQD